MSVKLSVPEPEIEDGPLLFTEVVDGESLEHDIPPPTPPPEATPTLTGQSNTQ